MQLDFSQFHPLDHMPASARCRSLPGGWRNHLTLAWHYKWPNQIDCWRWSWLTLQGWRDGPWEPRILQDGSIVLGRREYKRKLGRR